MTRVLYTPKRKKKIRRGFSPVTHWFFVVSLCAVAFFAALFFLLRISYFQIEHIEIAGAETLDANKIKEQISDSLKGDYWFFIPRKFIFAVDGEDLGNKLMRAFLKIRAVEMRKEFPYIINVLISERNLFGIFCNDLAGIEVTPQKGSEVLPETESRARCGYLDEEGFVYGQSPEASGNLLTKVKSDASFFEIGAQVVDAATMERMVFLRQELDRVTGIRISSFELPSQLASEMRLVAAEGFKIFVKKDDDFAKRFQVLKKVLDDEIKGDRERLAYIDLRFGNKVFYKMK